MNLLRKTILAALKITAFDLKIIHPLTHKKFILNTYSHKGYWYYGLKREEKTVKVFKKWIKPNDYVLEIGGHIGYFTTFFADLVGVNGKVDVFEPSDINLFYLDKNIKLQNQQDCQNISIIKKGAGDINGTLDFYIDPISGQNNSFVKNFEGFLVNRQYSAETNALPIKVSADVVTLDSFFENKQKTPDFVKVDVEGFEWNVIQGFKQTIQKFRPILMIEIQQDSEKLIDYFKGIGYCIYNEDLEDITNFNNNFSLYATNVFFKPRELT
jgi:FkbM family methyltransferase